MVNSGPLVPFGIAVIVLCGLLILVPYLRRKSDAITAWNIFIFGSSIFIGIGCLEVAWGNFHWPELQWWQPSKSEVNKFIMGATLFYVVAIVTYYYLPWVQSLGRKSFNKWPPKSVGMLLLSISVCLLLSFTVFVVGKAFFFGALFQNISHKGAVFAAAFSFCFWFRDKRNPVLIAIFLGVFAYAGLFSMITFAGRRLLLSVAAAPLVCIYWLHWRNLSPKTNLIRLTLAAFLGLSVTAFYGTIRHYRSISGEMDPTMARLIESVKSTNTTRAVEQVTGNWLHFLSQYCVHYSLLTMQLVDEKAVPVEPLNSIAYVATYPIPRGIFPRKPSPLGGPRLVNEILRMPYPTNWGLGIVGNGYQEGGMLVIALYTFLAAAACRVFDDALRRQPDNVFLLGMLCASMPHIMAWTRGEVCIMTTEVIEAVFFGLALSILCRFAFGTVDSSRRASVPPQMYQPAISPLNSPTQMHG
jgi:hypothetical protein